MAFKAEVSFADGDSMLIRYRLTDLAKYLRAKRAVGVYRKISAMPVTPWLIDMAFTDAKGKEITAITIEEKVI